jgi:hypothetical protein
LRNAHSRLAQNPAPPRTAYRYLLITPRLNPDTGDSLAKTRHPQLLPAHGAAWINFFSMNELKQLQWRQEPTKSYTARIAKEAWEPYKEAIIAQYDASTLENTRQWMKDTLGLHPSYENLVSLQH